ncbi:unnamed protein product [Closterium sp. NIES-65]|nr:unnamed protein product [Closterium sp. NIES-65]
MKTRDVLLLQRLIVGALLSLLLCAAAAQPTKATLIKELQDIRLAMMQFKYLGRYALVANAIKEILPKLDSFPEDADLSVLGQKTVLIPQNAALGSAGIAHQKHPDLARGPPAEKVFRAVVDAEGVGMRSRAE